MHKKLFLLWMVLFAVFLYGEKNKYAPHKPIPVSKQMIEGKAFYEHSGSGRDSYYTMSRFKKMDPGKPYGDLIYVMMGSPGDTSGNAEYVSYSIKNGKIIIYGNGGSNYRLTLVSKNRKRWILMEEEDPDGPDKRFGFQKSDIAVWYLRRPGGYPPLERCKPVDYRCFVK